MIGADIGGIPELIEVGKTGELFESGSVTELCGRIQALWTDSERLMRYTENCRYVKFATAERYAANLMQVYT